MPRLFLVRHGEPETGWGGSDPDPGLSALGRRQARRAAQDLAAFGALAIVSSPMRRCRETALHTLEDNATELKIDPRVSEVACPPGVSDRRAWLAENFPWSAPSIRRDWHSLAEPLHEWRAGVLAAVTAIEQDTAMFTHFIAINAVLGAALERQETIVTSPDYASITELVVRGDRLHLVRAGAQMIQGDVQ
jgi:broad specificity phosphatase PhoE